MKLIAGISSTIALLSLLTWNNHATVTMAFVPSPTSSIYYSSSSTLLSATPIKITMPALSSTMKEGRVVSWLKSEGDAIEAGEAIMVVESDKADMDVEAFEDGFLAKILTGEGETAEVGAVVALVAGSEEEIAEVASGDVGGEVAAAAAVEAPAAAVAEPAQGAPEPTFPYSKLDMPALSSTMKEGKVVSWLKSEGDAVSSGEAIMVVESDKADMDVEAFEDGYLAAIITGEGESCAVGSVVAYIAENEGDVAALKAYAASVGGGAAAAPVAAAAAPAAATAVSAPKVTKAPAAASGDRVVASPLAKKMAQEMGVDISSVVGTGPGGRITAADIQSAASGGAAPQKAAAAAPSKPAWTPAPGVIAATPTARALAKKAKLDLSSIQGTGEFGRVTADDVKIATGEKKPTRKQSSSTSAATAVELPEGLVPFTGMQRAVSNNMVATLDCPVFRASREIEMDAFNELYQSVKAKGVTVSALLAKAVAKAIEKHPIINSSFRQEGTFFNKDINIAMAVAIDGGLITPVLKYANERDVLDLGENWKELVGKAKSGTLSPDEYNSGTFVISNMGMFGVSQFDAILPKGIGGILAVAGTQEYIVPCKKSVLGMKKISKMTVTLTCDHRQIYGADAALFLKTLNEVMMNPGQLM